MTPDQLMAREALDLRLRFEFGLASLEEIELWADAWLLAFDKPRDELVDLALASRMGADTSFALLRQLNTVEPEPADILRVAGRFAGADLSRQQLKELALHIQGWALPATQIDNDPAGRLLLESIDLVDDFDLAETGQWGTLDEACVRIRRFLDEAKQFTGAERGAE
jgi:hypothetical protein